MNSTDDCQIEDGFINYVVWAFCTFDIDYTWIPIILMAVWLFVLFVGLGVTADTFFCPSLRVIADSMRLSQNIAGVTFLAFGNGAPDVFSAIAAVGNSKDGDAGLAFGALFGAGVFVSTVIVATICLISPFHSVQRPLLRDLIFFMLAGFWAFVVVYDGIIHLWETLGFLLLYVVYILTVVIGRYVNQRLKYGDNLAARKNDFSSASTQQQGSSTSAGTRNMNVNVALYDEEKAEEEYENDELTRPLLTKTHVTELPEQEFTMLDAIVNTFVPWDKQEWSESNFVFKLMIIVKIPVMFLLKLTVPLVDYDATNHNWNKVTTIVNCLTAPLFMVFATKFGMIKVFGAVPVWSIALTVGVLGAVFVIFATKLHEKPSFHWLFAYFGFLVSIVWIYSIANEIVNLLTAFGIILNLSNTILGLTFLAWGNSLSDLVADVFSAKRGFPNMGISACFGGPLFNILLGVGIPFTYKCLQTGQSFVIQKSFMQDVLAFFLAISLCSTLIFLPLNRFYFSRRYAIYLIAVYAVFIVVCILIESDVITNPF